MKTYKFLLEIDFNRELTLGEREEIMQKVYDVIGRADAKNEIVPNDGKLDILHHVLNEA